MIERLLDGPASIGIRNAFSQELASTRPLPVRPEDAVENDVPGVVGVESCELVVRMLVGPAIEVVDIELVDGLSTLISASCASRKRFLFIRLSSICSALSSFIPGRRLRSNRSARIIEKTAIMTMIEMSIVVYETWGNLLSSLESP